MSGPITVEWRKGPTGLGGTYTFENPKPSRIDLPAKIQKLVEFKIPLLSGSMIQLLNDDSLTGTISGFLVVSANNYDNLDEKRRDFEAGIGNGEGQLHLISTAGQGNSEHLYWKGVPIRITYPEGKTNIRFLAYSIEVLFADPAENVV